MRGQDPAEHDGRFLIAEDPELTASRLALARGVGQVIRNGLSIMGVTPVEEMRYRRRIGPGTTIPT